MSTWRAQLVCGQRGASAALRSQLEPLALREIEITLEAGVSRGRSPPACGERGETDRYSDES